MFSMAMSMVVLVVGLTCSLLSIPHVWAQVIESEFLHIDCGAPSAYTDNYGVAWVPDDDFISTGEKGQKNDPLRWQGWTELQYLRYFPSSRAKNCYTLPVTSNRTYMLRAEFLMGSYDGTQPSNLSFQIAIDSSIVENVTIPAAYFIIFRELTFAPTRNVTSLCLVRDASKATPFISAIVLRAVPNLPPVVLQKVMRNQSVSTMTRLYFNQAGDDVIMYDKYPAVPGHSDVYDRYWFATNGTSTSGYPLSTAGLVTSTAPLKMLSILGMGKNVSVTDTDINNDLVNNVPQGVLQGAMTTTGNLTIPMNTTTPFSAYMQYYFVELDATVNSTDRSFFVDSPAATSGLYQSNIFNRTGGAFRLSLVRHVDAFVTYDSKIVLSPDPARTSLEGPIISGLEVFKVDIPWVPPTNDRDHTAVELIKTDMLLTSWGGDPCLPYPHDWLTCSPFSSNAEAAVTAVLLSGYNLSNNISPTFNQLLSITSLKLNNNSLTGPIPDLRALKNLKILHLQNNNLTGPLPDWLASLPLQELYVQNNGLSGEFSSQFLAKNWNFNYSGNPSLKPGGSPPPSKTNIGVIIGAIIGGLVVLVVIGLITFCCCRRRGEQNVEGPLIEILKNPSPQPNADNSGGAREYSLAAVDAATENYRRVIGKGGFGPVYYGKLPGGKEVAVKALDKTSKQGPSEFFNEVDILSRVHHKHLVSLVGYCRAEGKQMLIYEYIHKGSLRDHLDGDTSKTGPEILDWKTRLNIGLQAALGLEYLHSGCSPSLIHRDVKSHNILITSKNDAKVADFGLSRLVGEEDPTQVLTMVKGTAGYLDPEYYHSQYLSPKSDVYSFGVVLLELITGRLPIDRTNPTGTNPNLCDWARANLMQGNIDAILDPKLRASRPSHDALWKVADVALRCVEPKSVHRPTMSEVVQELHSAVAMEQSDSNPNLGPPLHSPVASDYSSNSHFDPNSDSCPAPR